MSEHDFENSNNIQQPTPVPEKSCRRHFSKKRFIILSLAVIIIGFCILDIFVDPPAFWRIERQKDKRAILEYVERNYPNATKRMGGKFPLPIPAGPHECSVMYFELDGIEFVIIAEYGKVVIDDYDSEKAEKYICEKFIDSFMNERGLSPEIKISFSPTCENLGKLRDATMDDLYTYKGKIYIEITQASIDGIYTAKDVEWFYDFYQYWIENCDLPNCSVELIYLMPAEANTDVWYYSVWFQNGERTFSSEKDFYNHFTT